MEQSESQPHLEDTNSVHFEVGEPILESNEQYEIKASACEEVVGGFEKELELVPNTETFLSNGRAYEIETPFCHLRSTVQRHLQAAEKNLHNIRSETT